MDDANRFSAPSTSHRAAVCSMVCAVLVGGPALAQAPSSYGFAAGAFLLQFVGGMSGPETPISATRYSDTFDTGAGVRLEAFRDLSDGWRGQVGIVYAQWSGRSFTGGEFPAGAQFGDFSLAGPYLGLRYSMAREPDYVPYLLGNFGLVYLSSLNVASGGNTVPLLVGQLARLSRRGDRRTILAARRRLRVGSALTAIFA